MHEHTGRGKERNPKLEMADDPVDLHDFPRLCDEPPGFSTIEIDFPSEFFPLPDAGKTIKSSCPISSVKPYFCFSFLR